MEQITFSWHLAEALASIDRELAAIGLSASQRPYHAALQYVRSCVIAVDSGDGQVVRPGDLEEVIVSAWFRALMGSVKAWYDRRYGVRMKEPVDSFAYGTVCVFGTPFGLHVPLTIGAVEKVGKTAWLEFPDRVLDDESALDWLVDRPNFSEADRSDFFKAQRHAKETASRLRFADINLKGIAGEEPRTRDLADGVLPHLEAAARHLVRGDGSSLKRAHWDLQMAPELAFKALAQQRSGQFIETHDLYVLYDRLPGPRLTLARSSLSKLPNWERMADFRYGDGPSVSLDGAFTRYRACLSIVMGIVDGFERFKLGQARFRIKKAPWL